MLARAVREVQSLVGRGRATPAARTKFKAVALLVREEHARILADETRRPAQRAEQLKRLDAIATILARTAVRDPALLAPALAGCRCVRRGKVAQAGHAADSRHRSGSRETGRPSQRPIPSVPSAGRYLSRWSLDSWPTHFSLLTSPPPGPGPLFGSPGGLGAAEPASQRVRTGRRRCPGVHGLAGAKRRAGAGQLTLMPHQAQLVAAAAAGHRSFLLADEPGLGKTAQALLAAQATSSYPLLVVVPSVVKINWVREAGLWTPNRRATAVHGNGDTVDGFADIVVVNYEVLDRHVGWLGDFGFRGMIVDEAHFIKNRASQRSQHVLELSERIRSRTARPLLMALTGTPLINDIEDFRAIWQFLGWIGETEPLAELMDSLEETGLTPADPGFYVAARRSVIDLGIVRRRKVDVAADIPARRTADMLVELDGKVGRSIRLAERDLARRLVSRYEAALANRRSGAAEGIDHDLVRKVATWEQKDARTTTSENVFSVMRLIGQAKAGLAADYAMQLARSAGKVVFFAKHVDVMDVAEETFTKHGVRFSSIRGGRRRRPARSRSTRS